MGAVVAVHGDSDRIVKAGRFLRYMINLGLEERRKQFVENMRLQISYDRDPGNRREGIAVDGHIWRGDEVASLEFTDLDEARALEKLNNAAAAFVGNVSGLKPFECESVQPRNFLDLLKRTFGITLTHSEGSFILRRFDRKNTGRIMCSDFTVEFIRMGQIEKKRRREADVLKKEIALSRNLLKGSRDLGPVHPHTHRQAAHTDDMLDDFSPADNASAFQKLRSIALRYAGGAPPPPFDSTTVAAPLFREALQKTFGSPQTPFTVQEMRALLAHFDPDGWGVDSRRFCCEFLATSQEQKSQLRVEQRARRDLINARAVAQTDNFYNAPFTMDMNFSSLNKEAAMSKMKEKAITVSFSSLSRPVPFSQLLSRL